MDINRELLEFISKGKTAFHTVENIKNELLHKGAAALSEGEGFLLTPGKTYVVTRNMSSLIAFFVPEKPEYFKITSSHSDAPSFRLKERAGMEVNGYVKLNTEGYGGMIDSSWFDRPLSLAGRLLVDEGGRVSVKLYDADRNLCMIPNLAIHMNREINSGYKYNHQKDTLPLFGMGSEKTDIFKVLSEGENFSADSILACDLNLYNREKGCIWGADNEFISAPRLDDLACVFACLKGFMDASDTNTQAINMLCVFDNEEVGSRTKQGADSAFLEDTIRRICTSLSMDYSAALHKSFMISADNAHALHPNYPEKCDPTNKPVMNGGVVIKYNSSQRYMTDAFSAAVMKKVCEAANVPYQTFFNRSDMPGGSTLGNLSAGHVSIPGVDIGIAQLAMHSAYETMGAMDEEYLVRAMTEFYSGELKITEASFTFAKRS